MKALGPNVEKFKLVFESLLLKYVPGIFKSRCFTNSEL